MIILSNITTNDSNVAVKSKDERPDAQINCEEDRKHTLHSIFFIVSIPLRRG